MKVKQAYTKIKHEKTPEKKLEEIAITDEDLVELTLFDQVLSQIEHKFSEKVQQWHRLV